MRANCKSLLCSFILSCTDLLVSPLVGFTPSTRNFVDYAVLFSRFDRATGECIFAIELAAHCLHTSVSYLILTFWQIVLDGRRERLLIVVSNDKYAPQYSQDIR